MATVRSTWSSSFNALPLTDTIYPSFRQKTMGKAEFIAILQPTPAGSPPKNLNARMVEASDGAQALRVTTSEGDGLLIFSAADMPVTVDGAVKTDARSAFVQFDSEGEVKWAARVGGTMLEVKGKPVPTEPVQELSAPALPVAAASAEVAVP